jgi:hypothetical protein
VQAVADGSAVIRVQSGGIQAVSVVNVRGPLGPGEVTNDPDADYATYDLDLDPTIYPRTLTLIPGASRAISVTDDDGEPLDGAASRALFFASAAAVASVDQGGLVTALGSGSATISVILGGAQVDLPLLVTAPLLGRIPVGSGGGAVGNASGVLITAGPGTFNDETPVSAATIAVDDLPLAVPTTLDFVGGFRLDLGGRLANEPLQIQVPVDPGIATGTPVYFFRAASVPDAAGSNQQLWVLSESVMSGPTGMG